MPGFLVTKQINAPIQTVFDVLTDHEGYGAFLPGPGRAELEKPGTTDRNGVGAIRRIIVVGPPIREEIYRYDTPTHFSYGIISGAPVKEHRGDVVLEEKAGGTLMTYRVTFSAPLPLRPILQGIMRLAVGGQLVNGVARTAEARAKAPVAA